MIKPTSCSQLRDALWPDVSQPAKAHYAVDQGFWAALLISSVTSIVIWMGILPSWSWIDVSLFVIVAIGLRLRMRTAAVAGLLLFVASRAASFPSQSQQIIYTLLFLLAFINTVRGAFSLHKKSQSTTPQAGVNIIPPLRMIDFLVLGFMLLVFLVPFALFQGKDRTDFINTIRQNAGVKETGGETAIPIEPTTNSLAGGTKITLTTDWQIQQNPDAPKNSIFAVFRGGNMWALFQEESKADIKRGLGTDYVGVMTLDKYAEAVRLVLTSDLTEVTSISPTSLTIQGKSCLRFVAEGITQNVRLHFEPTVCDIGDAFLRATVWSPKSAFEAQRSKVEEVIKGLHW